MQGHRNPLRFGHPGRALLLFALCVAADSLRADTACLLDTEWSAAVERARLVFTAEETVDVSTFILGDEPFSLTSMAVLRDAARRDVSVRLLVDAQWNKLPREVQAHLLESGVQIRQYHPFRLLHPGWLTRRMHDKLLVVDGKALIAGGRNVESPYFGFGHQVERPDYVDADVLVAGDVVDTAAAYFDKIWNSSEVRPVHRTSRSAQAAVAAELALDKHFSWLKDRIAAVRDTPEAAEPICSDVGAVRFVHDPPGRKGKAPGVADALAVLLDSARESVIIESPYLVPTKQLRAGLLRAIERGTSVRILTNSLASTDNIWPQAAYVGERRWFVENGVELWEYYGSDSLHAKTAVLDGSVAVVGSFNLDPRSQRLNTELAVIVDDATWAAELRATMDAHLADSVQIGPDGRPIGFDERYPNASCGKKFKLFILRPFAPFIRGQI
jgi:cardiolipin synthase C